jgi:AcrR family transcriptional regulator
MMTDPETVQERVRFALIEEFAERGHRESSVAGVIDRAGITEAEFRLSYEDLDDCAIRVYEGFWEEFTDHVVARFESSPGAWRDKLRAAAYAAAGWIEEKPAIIRFGMSEMFKSGLIAQAKSHAQLQRHVDMVDAGRLDPAAVEGLSRSTAEAVFGAILETIVRNSQEGNNDRPASFVPPLMYIAVRPYLGHEAALEELEIAPPERARA